MLRVIRKIRRNTQKKTKRAKYKARNKEAGNSMLTFVAVLTTILFASANAINDPNFTDFVFKNKDGNKGLAVDSAIIEGVGVLEPTISGNLDWASNWDTIVDESLTKIINNGASDPEWCMALLRVEFTNRTSTGCNTAQAFFINKHTGHSGNWYLCEYMSPDTVCTDKAEELLNSSSGCKSMKVACIYDLKDLGGDNIHILPTKLVEPVWEEPSGGSTTTSSSSSSGGSSSSSSSSSSE